MRVERALVGLMCVAAVAANGCGGRLAYNLPPSSRLMEPGPGVGGPGPGVIPPAGFPYGIYGGAVGRFGDGMGGYIGGGRGECAQSPPMPGHIAPSAANGGVMQASYNSGCDESCGCGEACECGADCAAGCAPMGDCNLDGGYMGGEGEYFEPAGFGHGGHFGGRVRGVLGRGGYIRPGSTESYVNPAAAAGVPTSQIAFLGDDGVQVSWDVGSYGLFDSTPLVIPGRQDFYQGAIYRLRLTNIPGRPGIELFPTLEVAPVTPRTDAYLAHSPIPVQFTEEDFDQVLSGNFVTKVIYLPDPEFQELALAGVETLVSTRLDPGVDPIAEADRRGSILAILRMGNKDLRRGGAAPEYEPQSVVPASHVEAIKSGEEESYESQALYNEQVDEAGMPTGGDGVVPAQYCGPYGDGSMGTMPMGMPTRGFAPPAVPPNMVAGAPTWGMPITGTPIGLPGPPHVPLGVPAGLQKHVMTNRTRVLLPPPTAQVHLSVKQRPGLNYPRPVTNAYVDETQREPLRLMPGWLSGLFSHRHQPDCQ
ncbi:MAG: hypothetical protein WD738_09450 [Pirellulales bacterium]